MFKNILVAIDLSPRSCKALEKAIQFAHLYNANLTLLNVHEEFLNKDEMIMSRVSVDKLQTTFQNISIKSKEYIKHLITDMHGDDINTNIVLREGKPGKIIIEYSKEVEPDIIIVGSNGKDSITDYIVGTTTAYVVDNSKIPVLVVPDFYDE